MNGQEAPSYHLTRGLTYQFHMDPIDYAQAPLSLYQSIKGTTTMRRYEGGDVTYISPTIANQFLCLEVIADSLSPRTGSSSMTTNTVNSIETLYFDDHLKNGVGGV